jgi:hypothetical protein
MLFFLRIRSGITEVKGLEGTIAQMTSVAT